MTTQVNDWRLEKLSIERIRWGDNEGQYKGSVKFTNGNQDEFTCRIDPDRANQFITPVSDVLMQNAHELVRTLRGSLETPND